jgi:predicted HTH transcriptional regulator
MLWFLKRPRFQSDRRKSAFRTRSAVATLTRQEPNGDLVKRERWTEHNLEALPAGEHDYFERKSGSLFDDTQKLLGAVAKAVSAFANSGGGHLLLGVCDDGSPDGVPPTRGSTATHDWLDQKLPHLVSYPLSDFRVHVVERSTPSRIPTGREVVVIDIGDSALAPHQCNQAGHGVQQYAYYHRRGGRSEPAPHFI